MSSPDLLVPPDSIDAANVGRAATTANKTSSPELDSASSILRPSHDASCDNLLFGATVQATPYPHQVGGHGQLTKTSNGALLKPVSEKEFRFYSYIHSDRLPPNLRWLRCTTPKFYGETMPPASGITPSESAPSNLNGPSLEWLDNTATSSTGVSPWALTMGNRVHANKMSHRKQSLIALEDINHKFIFPSVLDCKIGTRHYDDDATEEKRRRHILKSNMTTSAKYGIRFTGMQSYKRVRSTGERGVLEFRDKYYGRDLKGTDLVPEARWFFDNGLRVRTDCIRIILEKLEYIRQQAVLQTHFKFYSSSLLLVYEGASADLAPCNADVRMIDFAHTQWRRGEEEPDDGYNLGIETLMSILRQIITDEDERVREAKNIHLDTFVETPISPSRSKGKGRHTKAASV